MSSTSQADGPLAYSWHRDDFECKIGFRRSRFTRVSSFLWFVAALILTIATYGVMGIFPDHPFVEMFTKRGPVQYVIVLFAYWSLLTLLMKMRKTRLQAKALDFTDMVPNHADFVLSPATVNQVLTRLRTSCDDPTRFILFNRIELALSNLKNMGRIGDVDDVLRSQALNDEDVMESSYSLIKGLIWAIPVLGFIGTVQGLSRAIGGFGSVLNQTSEISELRPALQKVTGGLSVAFETTFVALIAALIIQLFLTVVRKGEEQLLDDCKEYCQRHVISRLRIVWEGN